jgi:hypothetical protein
MAAAARDAWPGLRGVGRGAQQHAGEVHARPVVEGRLAVLSSDPYGLLYRIVDAAPAQP